MKKQVLFTASLLLASAVSFGAGFQLNLQGLRQLAMGGTGTAMPWDASTIFYNPAGLSRIKGVQVSASALLIMPNVQYAQSPTGSYTARSQSQTFTPFNVYLGASLGKGWGVGVGVYTPFGSGLKWDDNWTGRYLIQSIELQSIFIQPTLSYRINEVVSVGAGFVYAMGNLDLNQALPVQNANGQDGKLNLNGNANGIGFNAGVHIKASDKVQFGITYRSQVNMKLKSGDATFTVPASLQAASATAATGFFPANKFSTELPLPQVLSAGIAVRPIKKLTLQFDVNYVGWSAYDSLKIDFEQTNNTVQNNHAPRMYENKLIFRLGGNYNINRHFSVMAGGAIDPTPVADGFVSPELPDANHTVLTCGVAVRPIPGLSILAALEYVTTAKREGAYNVYNFNGTYQTKAITPGIGINYTF